MDIKDKMLEAIDCVGFSSIEITGTEKAAESCAKIADDFAIEFAEWKDIYSIWHDGYWLRSSSPAFDDNRGEPYSTAELLQLFKQQK